jgi:hypothetical protein
MRNASKNKIHLRVDFSTICPYHTPVDNVNPITEYHMSFFSHLICADCGSDNIQSNGDNDCCCDCGSHDYEEIESDDDLDPIAPLVTLFAGFNAIYGGKP